MVSPAVWSTTFNYGSNTTQAIPVPTNEVNLIMGIVLIITLVISLVVFNFLSR